jgi:putative peptidoglycan lipid II flippase
VHSNHPSVTVNSQTSSERSEKNALKKSLTIATVIMMASVFLSRVIGLVREQVIAHYGGTSTEIDAYVTAFFIPEILNHFLAGGFLSITFIPIFQRHLAQSDPEAGWRSFSNILTVGTIAFAIIIPVSMFFTPDILRLMGQHIANERTLPLTVRMTRIILPAQLFFYWGAFFSAVQFAYHRFFWPACAPLFYNAGIILGGVLLRRVTGVEGFAWGVLGGAFAANVLFQQIGARGVGMRYRFRFDLSDPDLRKFLVLSLPLILGLTMTFSNEILFRFFGSFLGEGGTSSINYALRTMGFVVAIFGQASGVAFYPYLSRLAIEQKFAEITSLLNRALTAIATYCIPLSLLLIVCAPQVISLLYEHGRFSAASTARTAPVFALYMIGAFAFSAAIFVVRPFYAVQKMYVPVVISSAVFIISFPLYYLTSKRWGAPGIAASAVAGMVLQFLLLYVVWNLRYGDRGAVWRIMRTFGIILGISVIGAGSGWLVKVECAKIDFGFGRFLENLVTCAAASVPALAVIALLYQVTGIQQVHEIIGKNKKKS